MLSACSYVYADKFTAGVQNGGAENARTEKARLQNAGTTKYGKQDILGPGFLDIDLQVATVAVEATQLVLGRFKGFLA